MTRLSRTFTLGVVNVWGGECLGGERLTIADDDDDYNDNDDSDENCT